MVRKSNRLYFLVLSLFVFILGCADSTTQLKGKIDFHDSTIKGWNYTFGYRFLDSSKKLISEGDIDIKLMSRFFIPIVANASFIEVYIKKVEQSYPDRGNPFLVGGNNPIDIRGLRNGLGTFYVTTPVFVKSPENDQSFSSFDDILFKWEKKRNIDYYMLEIFTSDDDQLVFSSLIPKNLTRVLFSELETANEVPKNLSILGIDPDIYKVKDNISKSMKETFYVQISGFRYNAHTNHLEQTILKSQKENFIVE